MPYLVISGICMQVNKYSKHHSEMNTSAYKNKNTTIAISATMAVICGGMENLVEDLMADDTFVYDNWDC